MPPQRLPDGRIVLRGCVADEDGNTDVWYVSPGQDGYDDLAHEIEVLAGREPFWESGGPGPS